jgi:hypothetical protein
LIALFRDERREYWTFTKIQTIILNFKSTYLPGPQQRSPLDHQGRLFFLFFLNVQRMSLLPPPLLGVNKETGEQTVLILDIGGESFDVSLLSIEPLCEGDQANAPRHLHLKRAWNRG